MSSEKQDTSIKTLWVKGGWNRKNQALGNLLKPFAIWQFDHFIFNPDRGIKI